MSELVFENVCELTSGELKHYGQERFDLLSDPATADLLVDREIHGTLSRNNTEEASCNNLRAVAEMSDLQDTFLALDSLSNTLIGIGSIQHRLDLMKQRFPFPTQVARKLAEDFGIPLFSRREASISDQRSNVSAWTVASDESTMIEELADFYTFLREQSDKDVWTITPASKALFVQASLQRAGFSSLSGYPNARYDDGEVSGGAIAPISRLYVADMLDA